MNFSFEQINEISASLASKIEGFEIIVCFSQNKDELIIGLASKVEDFWIQADLSPEISALYFPQDFHRAKKNSVNLFPSIISQKITAIKTHTNERSFHFELENNQWLVFKMHGKNSNILLLEDKKVVEIFRNNLEKDFQFEVQKLAFSNTRKENSALEKSNQVIEEFKRNFYFESEKNALLKSIHAKISKTEAYILKTTEKLVAVNQKSDYEKIGHIIMANLHLKIENQASFSFYNFYDNSEIEIKLKPEWNLQKNAENYYRKAKNQRLEIQNIEKNIVEKEKQLQSLRLHVSNISTMSEYKEIKNYSLKNKLETTKNSKEEAFPFLKFEIESYQIWVGKSAQNNDLLTLKYAHKEDLWLHAKDVSGSHVIIKNQAGKTFPKSVIKRAAELAAFYSKRKNDTLAPVTFTPKKYVRKPKGFEPGQVIVEKEETILVEPKL